MKTRALDQNRDWQFGRGIQSYVTELNALKQDINTRLNQWKGDCFYATEEGVDWINLLDIGTKIFLDQDIKRVILQTGGVLRITKYSSTLNEVDRGIRIEATISTVFGETLLNEVV